MKPRKTVRYVVEYSNCFQDLEWRFDPQAWESLPDGGRPAVQPANGFSSKKAARDYRRISKSCDPHLSFRIVKVTTVETRTVVR